MIQPTNYNEVAKLFVQHKKLFSDTDFLGLEFIQKQISDTLTDKTILDYGCGNGTNAARFANLGAKVVGVDRAETLLEDTKNIKNPLLQFQHISGKLSLAPNTFDGAYSTYVTCVIPTQTEIIDIFTSVHSALKPGAKFCLMNVNREEFNGKRARGFICVENSNLFEGAPITALLQTKEGNDSSCFLPVQDFFYSKNKYAEMLQEGGFSKNNIVASDLYQTLNVNYKTFDETKHSPIFVITAMK